MASSSPGTGVDAASSGIQIRAASLAPSASGIQTWSSRVTLSGTTAGGRSPDL
jgi:hypothetical protein